MPTDRLVLGGGFAARVDSCFHRRRRAVAICRIVSRARRGRDDESVAVNRHLAAGAVESWRITRLKRRLFVWCLGAALLLVLVLASTVGAVSLPFAELFHALVGDGTMSQWQ